MPKFREDGQPQTLRRVVHRSPHAVYIADHYSTFYILEKLECGHQVTIFPQSDPLTAKRRRCLKCEAIAMELPPKKPSQSEHALPIKKPKAG